MGRKALVSEKDVFEAADTLTAEGREVTTNTHLGVIGAGSFTTIYKHLSAWQATRMASNSPVSTGEIPDAAKTAFATAWKIAASEAARELAALREKAAEDVRLAMKQFQEALVTIEKLEAESEGDAEKSEQLSKRVSELESALQTSERENYALKATAEQVQLQLNAQTQQLDRYQKDLELERQRSENAVTDSAKLQGSLKR